MVNNLRKGRNRKFVSYLERDLDRFNQLKIMVEYYIGGVNYFTGKHNKRGYRITLKPVNISENGFEESVILGENHKESGYYVFLEEANRFNRKRLEQIADELDSKVEVIADAFQEDDVIKVQQICKLKSPKQIQPKARPKEPEPKGMILVTEEIEEKLPPLYTNEDKRPEEIKVVAKFFHPASNWTWYVTEGERKGEDFLFFGYVRGLDSELGYFNLSELKKAKVMGLGVERDRHFGNHTLAEVMEQRL